MKRTIWSVTCLLLALGLVGLTACETDQPGVSSTYRSQYTDVAADTEDATEAAKETLDDLELRNVESRATAVDGRAVGYTADGTAVTVTVTRIDDDHSQVSVNVGTFGDPSLGKQVIAGIRDRIAD